MDTSTPIETVQDAGDNQVRQVIWKLSDEQRVKLIYVQLFGSFMVWVGDPSAPRFDSLNLALGDHATPILFGLTREDVGDNLSIKLSKKFNDNRPVYVAMNYLLSDDSLQLERDRLVFEFVTQCRRSNE